MKHYTLLLCAFLALTSSCDDMLDSINPTELFCGDPATFEIEETNFHIGSQETQISTKFKNKGGYCIREVYCGNEIFTNQLPPREHKDMDQEEFVLFLENWNYQFESSIISGYCDRENISITVSENTTGSPRKIEVFIIKMAASNTIVIEQD